MAQARLVRTVAVLLRLIRLPMLHCQFFWRQAEMPAREESGQSDEFLAIGALGVKVVPHNERALWLHTAAIVALLILLASPVSAQTNGQKAADWISTGLVGANVTADVIHDVRHHCVKNLILRNGLAIGSAELAKLLVHEDRPDHSDQKSFFSEHSALAMANYGWRYSVGFSIAVGAGVGRIAASKHHPADVLVGLAAGLGAAYLFPCEER